MEHTRSGIKRLIPRVGDSLLTNKRRPILTVVEDTCGVHDMLMSACDIYRYQVRSSDSSCFCVASCSTKPMSLLLTQAMPIYCRHSNHGTAFSVISMLEACALNSFQGYMCILDNCLCDAHVSLDRCSRMAALFPSVLRCSALPNDQACMLMRRVVGHARADQLTGAWHSGLLRADCEALT